MTTATQDAKAGRIDIIHALAQTMPPTMPVKQSLWPCLAPALVSAGLLWMCFFPLAWGWLGWVAIVPLLALARVQAAPRRVYFCAYLCGSLFFWPALLWMPVNSHMIGAWVLLSTYCAIYFPVTLWLIRLLDRKTPLPLIVTAPVAWTAMEFIRSFLLTGFAWYYLGHTQHTNLMLIQIADLGGVYLVSFLVAAVNAFIFDFLYQIPGLRDACRWQEPRHLNDKSRPLAGGSVWRPGLKYEAGLLLIAVVGTLIYGGWRLDQNRFERGPLVALLQTNEAQSTRDDIDRLKLARHYDALNRRAIGHYPVPELIVGPETSYPTFWLESSPKLEIAKIPREWRELEVETRRHFSSDLVKASPTSHLLGLNSFTLDQDLKERRFNSALFVQKSGQIAARFDKMHRVPFGEYVPLQWIPFIEKISPYEGNYGIEAGDKFTRFELGKYKFGVLICYEDTDPFLAPNYVRAGSDGPPVDFLINMSNDGWFNGSSEHDEHLAISRFRAIECRRALARSVNMGISAVIDGNGRILQPDELPPSEEPHTWRIDGDQELPVSQWHAYKKNAGVLLARIPLDTRSSLYAATGDLLPGGCWAIIGGVIVWSLVRRRKLALATGSAPR